MSLEQLCSRAKRSLESQGEYSLYAFSSTDSDRVRFESNPPSTMFGFSNSFSDVLHALRPMFAIQASSSHIRAAIESRPWPEDYVYLNYGYLVPVRIVENASQLYLLESPAFVRADMSLVLWGDNDELLLSDWTDVTYCLQNQFGLVTTGSTLMAGPSEYHTEGNTALPPLDDLPMLSMVPGSTVSYLHPFWSLMGSESLDLGSLQLELLSNNPSPDNASSSIGDSPLTADLGSISPHLTHLMGLSLDEEEDMSALASSDFTFIRDEEGSPVLSNNSGSTVLHYPPGPVPAPSATGSSSFRRHSVGEASAPAVRAIGQKTKRAIGEEDVYSGLPSITVEGVDRRIASSVRAFKRSRSGVVETTTATSAPALLSVPLPDVEQHARDDSESGGSVDGDSSQLFADLPPLTPSSLESVPSPSPSPSPAPAASTGARGSASGGQRRTRRRGGGGGPARPKRTPCLYCTKTFSRTQDAERHITTSCNASPNKTGVECPECHQVLSRTDAAKRHWRQHENPTCAPPEWATRAS